MAKLYRIKDWGEHYENNRTKDIKEMRWVPIPNSHDGEGYCQMVEGDDGAEILGAWVACIQVASRCEPRGTLMRKGSTPHTAETLASRTRLTVRAFKKMLNRAIMPSVGWMEVVEYSDVTIKCQETAGLPHLPAENTHPPAVSSFLPSIPSIPSIQEGVQGEKSLLTEVDISAIYEAYPRKVGKGEAWNAIRKVLVKLVREGRKPDAVSWLLERVQTFAHSPAGQLGVYTPHPATWFNSGRYDDDPAEWSKTKGKENGSLPATAARDARRARECDEALTL